MAIKTAPYGSWKSPITADVLVSDFIGFGNIVIDRGPEHEGEIYWVESHPKDDGRMVIMHRAPNGKNEEMTPPPFNVRTRVHEYGGGAFAVYNGSLYFSNYSNQRLYRQDPGGEPRPLTPPIDMRYADGVVDAPRGLMYAVREDHTGPGEAINTIVSLSLHGGDLETGGRVLVSGNNFYSNPRLCPDGTLLCWLTWNHPYMAWDGTELWVGELNEDGSLEFASKVAGEPGESIFQPEWSPDGVLFYVSDRTGWWNLYCYKEQESEALYPMEAEFGVPMWNFGARTYDFISSKKLLCMYVENGVEYLTQLDLKSHKLKPIKTDYSYFTGIQVLEKDKAVMAAGSPTQPASIIRLDLKSGKVDTLRRSRQSTIDAAYMSEPEPIEFPTENDLTAHAFFYPPKNPKFQGPVGELPPLVVMSHGGPTGSAYPVYRTEISYLTSRGIAVVDVDYGGSTGYGTAYRRRLNGQWGVMDVEDTVNAANYLVERGLVDGERLAITGGSAGGYTTLAAITFKDVFKAGSSHFGVADLNTLIHDTHKYESRYLHTLIAPYPERADLYKERSPINHLDNLNCALILMQGLEDKVVPPNQAEMMYKAVLAKGLPVAYLPFEGEQHGFRKAENIKRSIEADLYFYSKVFGFETADRIEPVEIENLKS